MIEYEEMVSACGRKAPAAPDRADDGGDRDAELCAAGGFPGYCDTGGRI